MHFQNEFYPQKNEYYDSDFPLLLFGFIQMKVDTTHFLKGCYDVVHYSVLRKLRKNNLCNQEFIAPRFE